MRTATRQDLVSMAELHRMAEEGVRDRVKAVVDLRQGIMMLGVEMHADEEAELLASGAVLQDL